MLFEYHADRNNNTMKYTSFKCSKFITRNHVCVDAVRCYMANRSLSIVSSSVTVPVASVTPLAAEWLLPLRPSNDFLNEAMAPVCVPASPAASAHQSDQNVAGTLV